MSAASGHGGRQSASKASLTQDQLGSRSDRQSGPAYELVRLLGWLPAGLTWMVAAVRRRRRRAGAVRRGGRGRGPASQVRVDGDVGFGAQGVPDPADPELADARRRRRRCGWRRWPGRRVAGSTASISRAPTWRTAERSTPRMATVMSSPTMGSAQRQPRATPPAPSRTARLVKPSVRACRPSATRAAEPIWRPTLMR